MGGCIVSCAILRHAITHTRIHIHTQALAASNMTQLLAAFIHLNLRSSSAAFPFLQSIHSLCLYALFWTQRKAKQGEGTGGFASGVNLANACFSLHSGIPGRVETEQDTTYYLWFFYFLPSNIFNIPGGAVSINARMPVKGWWIDGLKDWAAERREASWLTKRK